MGMNIPSPFAARGKCHRVPVRRPPRRRYALRRYDSCLRVQHLSNGGLRDPNPGINFVLMRLQYSLE
jgi:hypothetical protein